MFQFLLESFISKQLFLHKNYIYKNKQNKNVPANCNHIHLLQKTDLTKLNNVRNTTDILQPYNGWFYIFS